MSVLCHGVRGGRSPPQVKAESTTTLFGTPPALLLDGLGNITWKQGDIASDMTVGFQLQNDNIFNALLDKADDNGVDAHYLIDGARRNPMALGLTLAKRGRPVRFLGKKEVFDAPIIGQLARAMGGIRVVRGTGSDEPLAEWERELLEEPKKAAEAEQPVAEQPAAEQPAAVAAEQSAPAAAE